MRKPYRYDARALHARAHDFTNAIAKINLTRRATKVTPRPFTREVRRRRERAFIVRCRLIERHISMMPCPS